MTPIFPTALLPGSKIYEEIYNATLSNDEKEALTNKTLQGKATQLAEDYTKDIMQSYVARGQESHKLWVIKILEIIHVKSTKH